MTAHLPVLLIVLPLLGALTAALTRRRLVAWGVALCVTWIVFLGSLVLLRRVLRDGVVTYSLGGWGAPLGIDYRVDALNALFLVVVTGVAAVVTIPGWLTAPGEMGPHRIRFFHAVYLLCLTGLLGIVVTGDVFNMYVLLEVASLTTYSLVALGRSPRSRLAAFRYLVLGSVGATFVLVGIGYLLAVTGTLDMIDLSSRLAGQGGRTAVHVAVGFLVTGLAVKGAIFPLHGWLPDAYSEAPSVVAGLLSGTATKVGLYMLMRLLHDVLGTELCFEVLHLQPVFLVAGAAGILHGSVAALRQADVRRLLAYSSVAQVGYIVLGIALASPLALTGALVHVMGHAVTKGGLFLALGSVRYRLHSCAISDLRGLGRRMPWTAAAIVTGCLALVGMPLTVGFLSKWYLVRGALAEGAWAVAVVVVAGALLAAAYCWRLVAAILAPCTEAELPDAPGGPGEAPFALVAPSWLLVGASVVLGVAARFCLSLADHAARVLS